MHIAHKYAEPSQQLRPNQPQVVEHRAEEQRRPSLALRIRVRWNSVALDSALAGGANPDASAELALRARQLAHSGERERLAQSIDRLLELAGRSSPEQLEAIRLPFRRNEVEAVRARLVELADTLRAQDTQPARGLARVSLLVEDGRGPLYVHDPAGALEHAVDGTLAALKR